MTHEEYRACFFGYVELYKDRRNSHFLAWQATEGELLLLGKRRYVTYNSFRVALSKRNKTGRARLKLVNNNGQ